MSRGLPARKRFLFTPSYGEPPGMNTTTRGYRVIGQERVIDAAGSEVSPLQIDEHLNLEVEGRLQRVSRAYSASRGDTEWLVFAFTKLQIGYDVGGREPESWAFATDQLVGVNEDGSVELLEMPGQFIVHPVGHFDRLRSRSKREFWQPPRVESDAEVGSVLVRYLLGGPDDVVAGPQATFHATVRSEVFSDVAEAFAAPRVVSLRLDVYFKGLVPHMPGGGPREWYLPVDVYHEGIIDEATVLVGNGK